MTTVTNIVSMLKDLAAEGDQDVTLTLRQESDGWWVAEVRGGVHPLFERKAEGRQLRARSHEPEFALDRLEGLCS